MRMISVRDLDIAPGRLYVWKLARNRHEGLPVVESAVPPSHNQQSRLADALALREAGQSVPRWMGAAVTLGGSVDLAAIASAFRYLVLRHSTLLSGFRVDSGEVKRFILQAGALRLERHDEGEFADRCGLLAHIESIADRDIDPLSWPTWLFVVVVRSDSATVISIIDHIDADLHSLAIVAHEICELYQARSEGRAPRLAEAASYVEFCQTERSTSGKGAEFARTLDFWCEYLAAGNGFLPIFPVDVGGSMAPTPLVYEPVLLLNHDEGDAFEQKCRVLGGSVFSGLLACLGTASAMRDGGVVYRALAAMQTRPIRDVPAIGWYANAAPIMFKVAAAQDFGVTLRRAHRSALAAREYCQTPLELIEGALNACLMASKASWFSYVDYRKLLSGPDAIKAHDRSVVLRNTTFGCGVDMWTYRRHDGIYATVRYPASGATRDSMHSYVDIFRACLDRVVIHG